MSRFNSTRPPNYAGYKNVINGDKYMGRKDAVKFIDGIKYRHVSKFGSRNGPVWVRADSLELLPDGELMKLIEGEIDSFDSGPGGFRLS